MGKKDRKKKKKKDKGKSEQKGDVASSPVGESGQTKESKIRINPSDRERRLAPVHTALRLRQYKQALKLLQNLEYRYELDNVCLCLYGLTQHYLGNDVEALKLAHRVRDTCPVDEWTLDKLKRIYVGAQQYDSATLVYERAAALLPKDPEVLTSLHFAYLREGRHDRQQACAMQLYNRFGKKPVYLMWSVLALLLQFPQPGPHKLLKLGETMVRRLMLRVLPENHALPPSQAELIFRLIARQGAERLGDALEFLQSHWCRRWRCEQPAYWRRTLFRLCWLGSDFRGAAFQSHSILCRPRGHEPTVLCELLEHPLQVRDLLERHRVESVDLLDYHTPVLREGPGTEGTDPLGRTARELAGSTLATRTSPAHWFPQLDDWGAWCGLIYSTLKVAVVARASLVADERRSLLNGAAMWGGDSPQSTATPSGLDSDRDVSQVQAVLRGPTVAAPRFARRMDVYVGEGGPLSPMQRQRTTMRPEGLEVEPSSDSDEISDTAHMALKAQVKAAKQAGRERSARLGTQQQNASPQGADAAVMDPEKVFVALRHQILLAQQVELNRATKEMRQRKPVSEEDVDAQRNGDVQTRRTAGGGGPRTGLRALFQQMCGSGPSASGPTVALGLSACRRGPFLAEMELEFAIGQYERLFEVSVPRVPLTPAQIAVVTHAFAAYDDKDEEKADSDQQTDGEQKEAQEGVQDTTGSDGAGAAGASAGPLPGDAGLCGAQCFQLLQAAVAGNLLNDCCDEARRPMWSLRLADMLCYQPPAGAIWDAPDADEVFQKAFERSQQARTGRRATGPLHSKLPPLRATPSDSSEEELGRGQSARRASEAVSPGTSGSEDVEENAQYSTVFSPLGVRRRLAALKDRTALPPSATNTSSIPTSEGAGGQPSQASLAQVGYLVALCGHRSLLWYLHSGMSPRRRAAVLRQTQLDLRAYLEEESRAVARASSAEHKSDEDSSGDGRGNAVFDVTQDQSSGASAGGSGVSPRRFPGPVDTGISLSDNAETVDHSGWFCASNDLYANPLFRSSVVYPPPQNSFPPLTALTGEELAVNTHPRLHQLPQPHESPVFEAAIVHLFGYQKKMAEFAAQHAMATDEASGQFGHSGISVDHLPRWVPLVAPQCLSGVLREPLVSTDSRRDHQVLGEEVNAWEAPLLLRQLYRWRGRRSGPMRAQQERGQTAQNPFVSLNGYLPPSVAGLQVPSAHPEVYARGNGQRRLFDHQISTLDADGTWSTFVPSHDTYQYLDAQGRRPVMGPGSSTGQLQASIPPPPMLLSAAATQCMARLMVRYFALFGGKGCMFSDVQRYLFALRGYSRVMQFLSAAWGGVMRSLYVQAYGTIEYYQQILALNHEETLAQDASPDASPVPSELRDAAEQYRQAALSRFEASLLLKLVPFSASLGALLRYCGHDQFTSIREAEGQADALASQFRGAEVLVERYGASVPLRRKFDLFLHNARATSEVAETGTAGAAESKKSGKKKRKKKGKNKKQAAVVAKPPSLPLVREQPTWTTVRRTLISSAEPMLVLCVHSLMSLAERTGERGYLLEAVALLQGAVSQNGHLRVRESQALQSAQGALADSCQLRLQLMRLLCHPWLGGVQQAVQLWNTLEVGEVQLSSLPHLILGDAIRMGFFLEARNIMNDIVEFHTRTNQLRADYAQPAYTQGNFCEVLGFEEFRDRVDRAHVWAWVRRVARFLDFCQLAPDWIRLEVYCQQQGLLALMPTHQHSEGASGAEGGPETSPRTASSTAGGSNDDTKSQVSATSMATTTTGITLPGLSGVVAEPEAHARAMAALRQHKMDQDALRDLVENADFSVVTAYEPDDVLLVPRSARRGASLNALARAEFDGAKSTGAIPRAGEGTVSAGQSKLSGAELELVEAEGVYKVLQDKQRGATKGGASDSDYGELGASSGSSYVHELTAIAVPAGSFSQRSLLRMAANAESKEAGDLNTLASPTSTVPDSAARIQASQERAQLLGDATSEQLCERIADLPACYTPVMGALTRPSLRACLNRPSPPVFVNSMVQPPSQAHLVQPEGMAVSPGDVHGAVGAIERLQVSLEPGGSHGRFLSSYQLDYLLLLDTWMHALSACVMRHPVLLRECMRRLLAVLGRLGLLQAMPSHAQLVAEKGERAFGALPTELHTASLREASAEAAMAGASSDSGKTAKSSNGSGTHARGGLGGEGKEGWLRPEDQVTLEQLHLKEMRVNEEAQRSYFMPWVLRNSGGSPAVGSVGESGPGGAVAAESKGSGRRTAHGKEEAAYTPNALYMYTKSPYHPLFSAAHAVPPPTPAQNAVGCNQDNHYLGQDAADPRKVTGWVGGTENGFPLPQHALSSFTAAHWSLAVLVWEASACMLEAQAQSWRWVDDMLASASLLEAVCQKDSSSARIAASYGRGDLDPDARLRFVESMDGQPDSTGASSEQGGGEGGGGGESTDVALNEKLFVRLTQRVLDWQRQQQVMLEMHLQRWSVVQRVLCTVESLLLTLRGYFAADKFVTSWVTVMKDQRKKKKKKSSLAGDSVDERKGLPGGAGSNLLRVPVLNAMRLAELRVFLCYAGLLLAYMLQMWHALVPVRRDMLKQWDQAATTAGRTSATASEETGEGEEGKGGSESKRGARGDGSSAKKPRDGGDKKSKTAGVDVSKRSDRAKYLDAAEEASSIGVVIDDFRKVYVLGLMQTRVSVAAVLTALKSLGVEVAVAISKLSEQSQRGHDAQPADMCFGWVPQSYTAALSIFNLPAQRVRVDRAEQNVQQSLRGTIYSLQKMLASINGALKVIRM